MALTYRTGSDGKGSALTIDELDNNFRYFTGSHAITGSLEITNNLTVEGSVDFDNTLKIDGKTAIGQELIVSPSSSMFQVNGGIQVGADPGAPHDQKAGTFRYRETGGASYLDLVMKTGTDTYGWVNIKTTTFTP